MFLDQFFVPLVVSAFTEQVLYMMSFQRTHHTLNVPWTFLPKIWVSSVYLKHSYNQYRYTI